MTTCYGALVDRQTHRRRLDPAEREKARTAQEELDRAAEVYEDKKAARDSVFRALYDTDASPQSIAEATALDRTTVAKIVRPGPNYRARYER